MKTKGTVRRGHITEPGKMTIIDINNDLHFFTGRVKTINELELGKVYSVQLGKSVTLAPEDELPLPKRIYDFEQDFRQQILDTLRHPSGNNNVGVLLEGYKGQGKSLTAKQLAIESGLPVVLITTAIPKDYDFIGFLNSIKQDYCLLIDEFEKLFPKDDHNDLKFHPQDVFLSFLDGTSALSHKRLVILTTNSEIGDKFINRPGRIRYYKKFNFMSKQVFDAIVMDKLKNKKFKKDLEDELDIPSCTIDILTSIIEEINIQNKPYSKFKHYFNHKERTVTYAKYRKEKGGTWKWIEDVASKKEIGVENEYAMNVFGYGIKVISNDGETLVFEQLDYENPDREDEDKPEKFIFKAIKQKWEKSSLVF